MSHQQRYASAIDTSQVVSDEDAKKALNAIRAQQAAKSKRAKRPGQRPPTRPSQKRARQQGGEEEEENVDVQQQDSDIGDDSEWDEDDEEAADPQDDGAAASSKWKQRQETVNRHWQERLPSDRERLQSYLASQMPGDRDELSTLLTNHLQSRIKRAMKRHPCHHALSLVQSGEMGTSFLGASVASTAGGPLRIVSTRQVPCLTLHVRCQLEIPTAACSLCKTVWEVEATECGCYAATPVLPEGWIEQAVFNLYTPLAFNAGVSMNAYAGALQEMLQYEWSSAEQPPKIPAR